ncbi:DUF1189 domain-containing protein [Bacillus benzoevorans]|uniref:DUF1189 domain-containing protein n=1 Tax=Bacillus benzoevorans TaxID=1456 RepID=A0A7X0HR10_9BACI|nr:DUF1189 domain-containing protein [Bacillus benzoevorans]MBB6443976.1 hypothetical protein [Bacillus benzoevorans]
MNIFKQLIVSLYSPKDIATFQHQGIGKTILYVFLLVLISVLPSVYYFNTSMTSGFTTIKETLEKELPSFTIENGELTSAETSPITVNKGDLTFIFDSTGTVTQQEIAQDNNTIAFLKNEWVYAAAGQSQSFAYTMMGITTITDKDLSNFLSSMESMLPVMVPVTDAFIYLFSSAMKFIEVSLLALFGLLLQSMVNKTIQYRHLWRLSAYCVTLPTIFFTIMESVKTIVPGGLMIHWFVALIMLMLTLKEIITQDVLD